MKVRQLTFSAILLALGTILHYIVPATFAGMKSDFLLSMMFISIFITFNSTNIAATSIVAGMISALTTTFPGGQIPNIIDKCLTGLIVTGLIFLIQKTSIPATIKMAIIGCIGTIISGVIFIGSAYYIVGLPEGANFTGLFLVVVIPAAIGNTFITALLYQVIERTGKYIPGYRKIKANI